MQPKPRCSAAAGFCLTVSGLWLVSCLLVAVPAACKPAGEFVLPGPSGWQTWEAEAAVGAQQAQLIEDPAASGGRYLEAGRPEVLLKFAFQAPRPLTLRVRPVWWRSGDARPAKLFPYPLAPLPGPDALGAFGQLVFFTAPQAGRVGIADVASGRLVDRLDTGGYLTDLLVDTEAGRVYVTDALRDRLLVIDARKRALLTAIRLPAQPWSMVQHGQRLFVACRAAKALAVVDLARGRVAKTAALPAPPINLELQATTPPRLLVRFQQPAFDAQDLTPQPADQEQYSGPGPRTSAARDITLAGQRVRETYTRLRPHWLRVTAGTASQELDVSAVTQPQAPAPKPPLPWPDDPGPTALDLCGHYLFFTAPSSGRVGALRLADHTLAKTITVGGYLTDLVAVPSADLVYVADGLGNRVVVIDAKQLAVVRELSVPAQPVSLAYFRQAEIQRPGIVPPTPIEKVYVACRAGRALLALDAASGQVKKTVALERQPRRVRPLPMPDSGWWWMMADDRIGFALHPRVAVEPEPAVLDVETLAELPGGREVPEAASKHNTISLALPRAATAGPIAPLLVAPRQTIRVDGDLSEWQQLPALSLPADPKQRRDYPNWRGPADLSARCFLAWDEQYLYFAADVQDDKFYQPRADELIWQADCIQIAFDLRRAGSYDREYGFALSPTGPLVWCWYGPAADAAQIKFVARRRGEGVLYEAALPWSVLAPFRPQAGQAAGFTLAIMDSDGGEREGSLEWTPGIVGGKDPTAFGVLALADKASPEQVARLERELAGRQLTTITADNALLLRCGDQWLDVSSLADPQLLRPRPLLNRDQPGSLTFSLDGGPEYDWTAGLWMTPDAEALLVNDSEEYWQWNALAFAVQPGRHYLQVRLRSPYVRLDALQVALTPADWLKISLTPEPQKVHAQVPLPSYQGLFYYNEPVEFTLEATNTAPVAKPVRLSCQLRNYMDELVASQELRLQVPPERSVARTLRFQPQDFGRFTLTIQARTADGELSKIVRFVRLAKLEHPRLLLRPEDLPAARARMAQYPNLYRRYVDWLRRMVPRGGKWPDRFLPPGLTRREMGAAAPDQIASQAAREQAYGWRMYEAAWRMLAVEMVAMYLAPEHRQELMSYLQPLLQAQSTDSYCQFHHHGPFFPGAVAALVDMAPPELRPHLPLVDFFKRYRGQLDVLPWTLVTLEEPLTPQDRALIWKLAMLETNFERYFMSHYGHRGGVWWQNPWTGCHCPMHGLELMFMYFRNFFAEPRLFEKPFFRGFLTLQRYLDPIEDKRKLLPAHRGPLGEPWRWILTALCRHPLEKTLYRWDEWVAKLNGPLPDELAAVDDLMALKGMPYAGPIIGGAHHFTTGVVVPIALALGWYDPQAPKVDWPELPPTTLFDVDGWTIMRSGWDPQATEVYFVAGIRDHTPRHVANHFMIWRAGQALIGWPALWGDDGNNTPMWGNVPVAGQEWMNRWRLNLTHPRDGEHFVINRFSKPTWTYIERDRRLIGYKPAEGGWGGGLDLHGHTQTLYLREGRVVAYETWPQFDYVAGDGSNAWPLEEIAESCRQLIYLKPDTVVVYDRVRLGPAGQHCALVLATAPQVKLEGQGFTVTAEGASLRGLVLLPQQAKLSLPTPPPGWMWKGQQMLQIEPPAPPTGSLSGAREVVEYLTVFRTGSAAPPPLDVRLLRDERSVGVACTDEQGRPVEIRFHRPGQPLGGELVLGSGPTAFRHPLAQRIEDTYQHWASHPLYRAWMTDPRFGFVITEGQAK
jgi:DNA-binding beta-propeller fold protein YncE